MTKIQTLAKNIITSKEVEVTIIGQHSEVQTKVIFYGTVFVVDNTDLVFLGIEKIKANKIKKWLDGSLNVNANQSYVDNKYIDLSFNNDKKTFTKLGEQFASEVIVICVYADHYEVETIDVEKEHKLNQHFPSANKKTIKKLSTLKNWIEKRLA